MVPSDCAGLGTGLYFGGLSAASAMVSIILQQGTASISPLVEFLWSIVAFTIAMVCLAMGKKVCD